MEKRNKNGKRKRFDFLLYWGVSEDVELMDIIAQLKRMGKFAWTVRNGIRLMWTLGQGDKSVLYELFPNMMLHEQFAEMVRAGADRRDPEKPKAVEVVCDQATAVNNLAESLLM